LIKNRKVKQVGSLYTSMLLGILIGIGVSVINTRLLGPQQYGDLKFLQNLFAFVVQFLTLGIFVSGSRLLAQRKNAEIKNQLIGNLLILAAVISVALVIFLFVFSFFEEQIFHNELGQVIRIFSPLLFVFPFQLCLENIMQGDNRIYELSAFRLSPRILYFLSAISFNYFVPLSLTSALALQLIMLAVTILIMIICFKAKFVNIKRNVSVIWQENKTYGFPVYIGALAGVASNQLGGLSIGYFMDNTNVGFFELARTITQPLAMITQAFGVTFYKTFAQGKKIPIMVTFAAITISIGTFILFILFIKPVILFLYPVEYMPVLPLVYLIAIANALRGFGFYINRFLGAHGKGKMLRNTAFTIGVSNVTGFLIGVCIFGAIGAAITLIISNMIYLSMMIFYYKKYQNELQFSL